MVGGVRSADAVREVFRLSDAGHSRAEIARRVTSVQPSRLFVEACDRLGIEARRMNAVTISVATRRSVALLDAFIGPKR
jgi:hypothetical protein